ncbi:MAG: sulfite exporter TauE/SafE family protein [bacterium]|nr:sulfite exporter TauE/SafE family protein [bacterium]
MLGAAELFGAAFVASVFGSMVGLGGGFILVPMLRLFFGLGPAEAAGTSLVLVVANSGSGALTYLLQKRVHIKLGLLIALGGLPGSIIGAILVHHISAQAFDWIFGVFLVAVAIDMIVNAEKRVGARVEHREVRELKGMSYRLAVVSGFAVGLVGSLFGIGGGVIIVPTLLYLSELPAHAISATSHFGIVLTSPVGLTVHAFQHDIKLRDIVPLVAGGLLGGPLGARLSLRLKSRQLLIFVACALMLAAFSLALRHLLHWV